MNMTGLKAALLAEGTARVTGLPVDLSDGSHAGPGAGPAPLAAQLYDARTKAI